MQVQYPNYQSIKLTDVKCTNKLIRNSLTNRCKITPRGKSFWNSQIQPMNWKKAWSTPFQFCISNKIREIHFKILHNIYPCNNIISKFSSIENKCAFCGTQNKTTYQLFYSCQYSQEFWKNIANLISTKSGCTINLTAKDIITSAEVKNNTINHITNLFTLNFTFIRPNLQKHSPN